MVNAELIEAMNELGKIAREIMKALELLDFIPTPSTSTYPPHRLSQYYYIPCIKVYKPRGGIYYEAMG